MKLKVVSLRRTSSLGWSSVPPGTTCGCSPGTAGASASSAGTLRILGLATGVMSVATSCGPQDGGISAPGNFGFGWNVSSFAAHVSNTTLLAVGTGLVTSAN